MTNPPVDQQDLSHQASLYAQSIGPDIGQHPQFDNSGGPMHGHHPLDPHPQQTNPNYEIDRSMSYSLYPMNNIPNQSIQQPQGFVPIQAADEPLYVNAKQYHRILKRRIARARLEELNKIARARKPYLHESRHRHAMRRPRGPGGRFLTASEIAEQEKSTKSPEKTTKSLA
ncbi:subunit B of CCAAT-binding transcription factor [Phycomyces blakesleeanus NRRL 1555(-)]|uniref:Transcriptional activator HAP2 n=1 Tax=Phycomyces blakesleeanus (strain ATCC 8743b / DSM 1359 / FGSC 10004 / NBRC 33097 / NRRL 1555) TaxID=763407 RepID=A0A167R0D8_PHYB8|nr:subunit B of CCAAT-binding transcription factor [Phycomyces blakesleeanus NRRL 1555(-)]OAD80554.1 subunit B of CCAAT-binding transcription factor [Phycomyces blakesleeanus NRRL 1555(-)]|eukprot:XP_018298594.1 subunit B of CCAAT-binding transcription factor [Phycomyces blakesleeanus NRRL 1555(-)]